MTAVAGSIFTAAQFNTYIRDNLNETSPAKATTSGQLFVATGANSIAARSFSNQRIDTTETTTSTSYVDLATPGPAVTVTTGSAAIVWINATLDNGTVDGSASASFAISGATTQGADNSRRIARDGASATNPCRYGACSKETLTPGSNTFTMKYVSQSATTASFSFREIVVLPL